MATASLRQLHWSCIKCCIELHASCIEEQRACCSKDALPLKGTCHSNVHATRAGGGWGSGEDQGGGGDGDGDGGLWDLAKDFFGSDG